MVIYIVFIIRLLFYYSSDLKVILKFYIILSRCRNIKYLNNGCIKYGVNKDFEKSKSYN